ncbi:MAG: hypothetical protein KIH08_13760, partial [Candidatus Freyarchaeota archaeon]|nr:hypothetical protein [Candidatus Jordarchaeia archaeon]
KYSNFSDAERKNIADAIVRGIRIIEHEDTGANKTRAQDYMNRVSQGQIYSSQYIGDVIKKIGKAREERLKTNVALELVGKTDYLGKTTAINMTVGGVTLPVQVSESKVGLARAVLTKEGGLERLGAILKEAKAAEAEGKAGAVGDAINKILQEFGPQIKSIAAGGEYSELANEIAKMGLSDISDVYSAISKAKSEDEKLNLVTRSIDVFGKYSIDIT